MGPIKQILSGKARETISVSPRATVYDALVLMAEKDVGAVLVMDGDRLAGIFSERDYARKIILHGKTSRETLIGEIMTERVVCVNPYQAVEEAMALMTEVRCRHLPVVEYGKVIGIVSIGDLVKAIISEQEFVIRQLESYIMK